MQQPDVHFCLVSKQQVANIVPLLHQPFQPWEVALLVSRGMEDKGPHARKTIQGPGNGVRAKEMDRRLRGETGRTIRGVSQRGRSLLPGQWGGRNLTAEKLRACNTRLCEYHALGFSDRDAALERRQSKGTVPSVPQGSRLSGRLHITN